MKTKVKALLYLDLDVEGMTVEEMVELNLILSNELKRRTLHLFPKTVPGFNILQISKNDKLLRQRLQVLTGKPNPTAYELAAVRKSQFMALSGAGQRKWDGFATQLAKVGFVPIEDYPGHK